MVKTCSWCRAPLRGSQTKYCGNSCKAEGHAFGKALDILAGLPEPEFREVLKGVCRKRWGMLGRTRRLFLRFGEYRERLPEGPIRVAARKAVIATAESDISRAEDLYVFHGWTAQALSWIAQYLRKLDRAAKLDRKRREASSAG